MITVRKVLWLIVIIQLVALSLGLYLLRKERRAIMPEGYERDGVPGYYNTNKEEGEILEASEDQAHSQQAEVLAFFRAHPDGLYSRHNLEQVFPDWPYTSVGRSMTNLTTAGYLEKTENMVMGGRGKQVHTWRLFKPRPAEQESLFKS